MATGDYGATNQDEFNKTISEQPMVNYTNPETGGAIQDRLRKNYKTTSSAKNPKIT